ncbi:uncharacterized protein MONOS_4307 [Monocercomonoides exilis]|uniref:uncharacterized protein n=1 Tax=Monocercomonoides exilis TaxID=2049356 RepID=UPI003559DFEA|nr:hypothetical protein MONOS_4307 [Monocercomonoides exilis]|eukprot:MONOS_4307.1-p1 / transcript=MONOS_4307.1 / gene=MONOS_4307 / organism=Monocercomonoides_exilis_PA203 / gene_product=unspecified product / transcript_product=unspecified product / location=Mono_scaffold00113:11066-12763(-) / protein_length=425 / sequence_SO=supercontig / SO=protein_coding / is_pseudo=false
MSFAILLLRSFEDQGEKQFDEDSDLFSGKTVDELMNDAQIRAQFENDLISGKLDKLIPPYNPWWDHKLAWIEELRQRKAESPDCLFYQFIHPAFRCAPSLTTPLLKYHSTGFPAQAIPSYHSKLYVHCTEILFLFCYISRLWNGELFKLEKSEEIYSEDEDADGKGEIHEQAEKKEETAEKQCDDEQTAMELESCCIAVSLSSVLHKPKKAKSSQSHSHQSSSSLISKSKDTPIVVSSAESTELPFPSTVLDALSTSIERILRPSLSSSHGESTSMNSFEKFTEDERKTNESAKDFPLPSLSSPQFVKKCLDDLLLLAESPSNVLLSLLLLHSLFCKSLQLQISISSRSKKEKSSKYIFSSYGKLSLSQLQFAERKIYFFCFWAKDTLFKAKPDLKGDEGSTTFHNMQSALHSVISSDMIDLSI